MKFKKTVLIICLMSFHNINMIAQVQQEWVSQYKGPEFNTGWDFYGPKIRRFSSNTLIAINSNLYLTANSYNDSIGNDLTTLKYSTNGKILWERRYFEQIKWIPTIGIVKGNYEYIYISGREYNGIADFLTIKYDLDGNTIWSKVYNGPANSNDSPIGIIVDKKENIYITGVSYGATTDADFLSIKYNLSGDTLWTARYNSPSNDLDVGYFIVADDSGNVIVSGYTNENAGDYITIKYDSNGNELWVARYDGPVSSTDLPVGVGIDRDGNIYVSGQSNTTTGGGAGTDYRTIKYSPGGTELWVRSYNGPADSEDVPYDMTVDSSGNVYVTGRAKGSGGDMEFATVKYDSSGTQKWVALYDPANGEDYAKAIVLDDSGNVYVFGNAYMDTVNNYDFVTIKYDSSGAEQWTAVYARPGGYEEIAWSMVLDDNYNVYVTGYSRMPGDTVYDIITIKYCQFGAKSGFTADTLSITAGDTANFTNTGTNATWWQWDFGDGAMDTINYNPSHIYDSAGTYNVQLIAWNACGADTVSQTLTVTCQQAVSAFSYSDSLLIVSFTNSSGNATGWVWDFGDGNTDSIQDTVHTYDSAGVYNVCLFASNGCSADTFCQTINIVGVGIQDYEVTRGIGIFPNPNTGRFTLLMLPDIVKTETSIYIYNVLGEVVYENDNLVKAYLDIDISAHPKGIYFIEVMQGEDILVSKIIYQ